ncbi:MAG: hypothetical protein EXQ58_13185 [Acidobacteria bacterium]|nr:hypothetical protein [Acidobacteriota bacterium]
MENALIVRVNLYGWNAQNKASLAEWVLTRLESGQAVPGFHDVVFTPILANDLCDILIRMIESKLTGLYHVAGNQPCSKYDFALELARVFSLDESLINAVSIEDSFLCAPRPRNTALNTDKIVQALGQTIPDLRSGLRRYKVLRDSGMARELKTFLRSN